MKCQQHFPCLWRFYAVSRKKQKRYFKSGLTISTSLPICNRAYGYCNVMLNSNWRAYGSKLYTFLHPFLFLLSCPAHFDLSFIGSIRVEKNRLGIWVLLICICTGRSFIHWDHPCSKIWRVQCQINTIWSRGYFCAYCKHRHAYLAFNHLFHLQSQPCQSLSCPALNLALKPPSAASL